MKKWPIHNRVWPWLAGCFFTFMVLGQLQRWQLTPGIAVYGHDVVASLGAGLTILKFIPHFSAKKIGRLGGQSALVLLLGAWIGLGLLGAAWRHDLAGVGGLYLLRLAVYSGFSYGLVTATFWSALPAWFGRLGLKPQSTAYWLAGMFFAYFGLLQYFLLPDTRFLGILGWDTHYYRLIGTLLDPGYLGIILVLTLILSLTLKVHPVLKGLIWGALTIAIALTYSRASYLAFGVVVFGYGTVNWWQKRQLPFAWLLLPIFLLAVWLAPKPGGEGVRLARTSTIAARLTSSQTAVVKLTPRQWWFGRGIFVPSQIESQDPRRPDTAKLPDNLFILVVTSLGLGGSLLLLGLLYQQRRWWFKLPLTSQLVIVAVVLHSQFNNTVFQPIIFLFWLGIVLTNQGKKHETSLMGTPSTMAKA